MQHISKTSSSSSSRRQQMTAVMPIKCMLCLQKARHLQLPQELVNSMTSCTVAPAGGGGDQIRLADQIWHVYRHKPHSLRNDSTRSGCGCRHQQKQQQMSTAQQQQQQQQQH
jgi:hypothetical protein